MPSPESRNVIPDRIAEALQRFPPFSLLPVETVAQLGPRADVQILVAGDFVWKQGEPPGKEVRFLARGRVEYLWAVDGSDELVDVRDVGDILGLTALLDGVPHRVSARVVEDSVLYCLPWTDVRPLVEADDGARNYVRRHLLWGTRVGRSVPTVPSGDPQSVLQAHLDGARVIEVRPLERLLTCEADDPIAMAAELMVAKRVPSVLVVDPARHPIGIVSSNLLVKQVIVGGVPATDPVASIMARPVVTVSPQSSATAAILTMLRERIGQVCVTVDGTPQSPALDVCTQKDLLSQSGQHPAGLIREIRLARSSVRLREICEDLDAIARTYLESGISGILMGQICAEIFDELVIRLIELARSELAAEGIRLPKVPWAWIAVGSDGRREQVLRTDMDNALVFGAKGARADEAHREVLLQLAERVVGKLVECGFSRCQGGVMALNPKWCRTDAEWLCEIQTVGSHAEGEPFLRALVLYDMRHVAGDKAILEPLREAIFDSVAADPLLQHRMAEAAVATPPPLNFWGKFVVEKKGGNAGEFDIKARGLAPLRDAARLLALKYRLTRHYSTGGRWNDVGADQAHLAEIARLACDGYDVLLRLRILTGLRRGDAGRFLEPARLTKLERAQLANVFDILRMVQSAVQSEFHLDPRGR